MKYKAFATGVVSVEPGKVSPSEHPGCVFVESQPLSEIDDYKPETDCIVLSLESGPSQSVTEHALNFDNSRQLMIDLLRSLCAARDPLALAMIERLPQSPED